MPYDPAGEHSKKHFNSEVHLQSSDVNETNIGLTKERELPSLTKEWKMVLNILYIIGKVLVLSLTNYAIFKVLNDSHRLYHQFSF